MLSQPFLKVPIKVLSSLLLVITYMVSVPKKKQEKIYFILILLFALGDVFYSYPIRFFVFSLVFYIISYVLFTIYIYKTQLRDRNSFKIFTFASPFIFTYGVIFSLLKNLNEIWFFVVLLAGIIASISGSIITLSYANKRSDKNLLFFMGIFIIQMMNFFAGIYFFNIQKEVYYLAVTFLGCFAQYLICLGFIVESTKKIITPEGEEVIR